MLISIVYVCLNLSTIDSTTEANQVTIETAKEMVERYLAHPKVVKKNPAASRFDAALRVFAGQECNVLTAEASPQPSGHASSTQHATQELSDLATLLERLRVLREQLNEDKNR